MDEEEECECGDDAAWMATFADLSTLLLTFFVLLLSFANLDVIQFRMALGSVKDALGVESNSPGDFEALSTSPVQFSKTQSSSRMQIMEELRLLAQVKDLIKEAGLDKKVEASISQRGVVLRVKGKVLFSSGNSDLRKAAPDTLNGIVKMAKIIKAPLMIEGHTDNSPIKTKRFPSNWELSAYRAIAAMRYMADEKGLDPKRLSVAGYSDTRPLGSNKTAAGRAKNRRVEFIFLRPKAGKGWKVDGDALKKAKGVSGGDALDPSAVLGAGGDISKSLPFGIEAPALAPPKSVQPSIAPVIAPPGTKPEVATPEKPEDKPDEAADKPGEEADKPDDSPTSE